MGQARLGVDIGGTFTDVALEAGSRRHTLKVLTTPRAPEQGVMQAVRTVLKEAGLEARDLAIVIHGTTLVTNAIIERKGARTALVTTEGFRDSLEMGTESRFEQYDIFMDKPAALVPRHLRLPVPERINARGDVLLALDRAAVESLVLTLERERVESIAVGFLHSFVNPAHENAARDILARRLPGLSITLSSEVSPEMREYERFSTACANAYVQPLMARYLDRLERDLQGEGFKGALFMMLSEGGLATADTVKQFPIRLVESGPAGGAIFSGYVARQCRLDRVLSFDMGGTTAKICMIDGGRAQTARRFEVARVYRFLKGSGIPIRVPVIEMVEIGAGGGSIAKVDAMRRIAVGPESAGAEPGPACYGRGGTEPTVTDADLALGRIDPNAFSGGRLRLDEAAAAAALDRAVGRPLGLAASLAAFGVGEMVDENMANAARVHAIESGKNFAGRTLVAFGGAAPLHATRVADKLGIERIVVPLNAGVGSAVGFLRAPIAYEVVRSHYQRLGAIALNQVNRLLEAMAAEARAVVARGASGVRPSETRTAFMRYVGQGHEIAVPVPARRLGAKDAALLRRTFERAYARLYGRLIPGVEIEALSWSVTVSAPTAKPRLKAVKTRTHVPRPDGSRGLFDPDRGAFVKVPTYRRERLAAGARIAGPAIIVEDETSTVVGTPFVATVDGHGYIIMSRHKAARRTRRGEKA